MTDVIFRRYKDGDIIALFPSEPGNTRLATCLSYQHIGQHGAADLRGTMEDTTPASEKQFASLKQELEDIGYSLRLVKRPNREHDKAREKELAKHG